MKHVLSDAERRLLGDGARYLEDHFDEIDPHFIHLSREEVATAARFIAGQGEPIGTRDFANLTMLALVLEGLAADGCVALSESALKDTYERLEALRLSSAGSRNRLFGAPDGRALRLAERSPASSPMRVTIPGTRGRCPRPGQAFFPPGTASSGSRAARPAPIRSLARR